MSKRSFKVAAWTPVAVADTTNFTNNGHMTLLGGSSTQMTGICEVAIEGTAGSSAVCPMLLSHDSTVGASLSALSTGESDAALHTATAALAAPVQPFTASSTKPQRAATLGLLTCGFNAFGGKFLWRVYREEDYIWMLGNTASLGEISLSCFNTNASPSTVMSHINYETK